MLLPRLWHMVLANVILTGVTAGLLLVYAAFTVVRAVDVFGGPVVNVPVSCQDNKCAAAESHDKQS